MSSITPRKALVATILLSLLSVPLWAQQQPATTTQPPAPVQALTLKAATEYALQHNPELLAIQQEVAMAQANLRIARAARRFQASANGYASSATHQNMVLGPAGVMPDDMRMIDPGQNLALDARITKSLTTGGRLGAAVAQRQQLTTASEADVEATRLMVYYQTRAMYRMALLNMKMVEVSQKEVEARQEMLRVDEEKLNVGKIPLYYYLRDKTALAQAQQDLANAQRDMQNSLYQLSTMLGLDRPQELCLTDVMSFIPTELNPDEALQTAAASRPELAAARARIEAAGAQISVARAAYKPQLAATVIFDWMTGRDMDSSGGYTAALVAGIPLVDAGTRAAEVAMAQAQQQQATQRERQLAQQVAKEVLTAIANFKAADQNVRTSLEAQAAAEEDYRAAKLRYDVGKAINLEPLDALASLVRARVNAAQALYEYNNAVDDLQRAQGQFAPPEMPASKPL
ncbi:MAG: TolC family protein [Armatimonadota bacterium]